MKVDYGFVYFVVLPLICYLVFFALLLLLCWLPAVVWLIVFFVAWFTVLRPVVR